MKQLIKVSIGLPDSRIEVIGHGINILKRENTLVLDKIQMFKTKGVTFKECENTRTERNNSKNKINCGNNDDAYCR